jgi:hypothetical protein
MYSGNVEIKAISEIYNLSVSVYFVSAFCLQPASCLAYSSILKMEAILSSERSVNFCRTERHYILTDSVTQNSVSQAYSSIP